MVSALKNTQLAWIFCFYLMYILIGQRLCNLEAATDMSLTSTKFNRKEIQNITSNDFRKPDRPYIGKKRDIATIKNK